LLDSLAARPIFKTMPLIETAPQRMRFTRERFDAMVAAGLFHEDDRAELIDGEIYRHMPPGSKHIARVNRIQEALVMLLGKKVIVSGQNPIALSEFSEPQPDIAVLKRTTDFYENRLAEPPDIFFVVEVSSSSLSFDRDFKLPKYAASQIPEVWIMDVAGGRVTVYSHPQGDRYLEVNTYGKSSQIPLTAFPGITVAAADLGL
jgi:Uma2 family endonuclease